MRYDSGGRAWALQIPWDPGGTELEHRGELDEVHQVTDHKPPPGADGDDVCGAKSVNCESGRDPEDPVHCSARVASAAGCGGTATNCQAFCLGRERWREHPSVVVGCASRTPFERRRYRDPERTTGIADDGDHHSWTMGS